MDRLPVNSSHTVAVRQSEVAHILEDEDEGPP